VAAGVLAYHANDHRPTPAEEVAEALHDGVSPGRAAEFALLIVP
jgi:hypothetical protein